MDFSLSADQSELLERLDAFCDEHLSESEVQKWLADGGVPDSFMRAFHAAGFASIGLPSCVGGKPASVMTRVLMLELLGKRAGASLPIQGQINGVHIVSDIASDEQIDTIRTMIAETGKPGFSFAITEPASGSDALNVSTTAVEVDDGFVINGAKSFVSSGQYAPSIVLIAHDLALDDTYEGKGKPLTFFLVPLTSPGVDTISVSKIGQRLIPTAEIILDNVRVPASAVMGQRGDGGAVLLSSYEYGRVYVCATSVGMAESAMEQAALYAHHHKISGSSIVSFQQIQELLTDMQVKVDAMRALLYKTAWELDSNADHIRLDTSLLKRFVPKAAMEVADSAMQIMGNIAYISTSRVGRIWQECRGNRLAEGTDQIMTLVAGKRIAQRAQDEIKSRPSWRF